MAYRRVGFDDGAPGSIRTAVAIKSVGADRTKRG